MNQPQADRMMQQLKAIKEILEDYACNPDDLSAENCAVQIYNLFLQKGRWCAYNQKIFCQESQCRGCPIWAKESGYLAYALSQL
jgi:hypothetical protein